MRLSKTVFAGSFLLMQHLRYTLRQQNMTKQKSAVIALFVCMFKKV
ncbi:hypothetical protein S7335_102 [Synechococcus sp. PCC 7335]|nr:hypothetical protein S7335_102 [Synechococcus sp. PCC 7335]